LPRSTARDFVSSRETCIWETPTRSAIWVCVRCRRTAARRSAVRAGQAGQRGSQTGAQFGDPQLGILRTEQVAQFGAVLAGTDQALQGHRAVGPRTVQTFDDLLLAALEVRGEVGHRRGTAQALPQGGGRVVDVELEFLQAARYPHIPGVVAEVPLDLPDDGGYRVRGEVVAVPRVEPVDRLDQSDGRDLGQVVQLLPATVEPSGKVPGQRQPRGDRAIPDGGPPRMSGRQRVQLLQQLSGRRVD